MGQQSTSENQICSYYRKRVSLFSLTLFQQLQVKTQQITFQLHAIHDPEGVLAREIETLEGERQQSIGRAWDDGYILPRVLHHYFESCEKNNEINFVYNFRNLTSSDERISPDFIPNLRKEIAKAREILQQANQTWAAQAGSNCLLDRQRALEILKIDPKDAITEATIKKAYHRLAKIHHPDHGGSDSGEAFKVILQAYEFLIPRPAPVTE